MTGILPLLVDYYNYYYYKYHVAFCVCVEVSMYIYVCIYHILDAAAQEDRMAHLDIADLPPPRLQVLHHNAHNHPANNSTSRTTSDDRRSRG